LTYDCIIIGGGLSGLVCGIRCAGQGLRCLVFSAGMSALHFSSGSIDVLGYDGGGNGVRSPLDALEGFVREHPVHPYARCGPRGVEDALAFFRRELEAQGLPLYANGRDNHAHVTTLGTLKPTFLSPRSVFNERIKERVARRPVIALLTVEGFRDFYPELAAGNLRRHPLFSGARILTGSIDLSGIVPEDKNPYEFRSIDIARVFDRTECLDEVAARINRAAREADIVGLPAFLGIRKASHLRDELRKRVHGLLYEIPTLPPSILGMRMDHALKSRFAELGGVFIAGDRVTGGEIRNGALEQLRTRNHGDAGPRARWVVLATGSFFSGGLVSDARGVREPVFGLPVAHAPQRSAWHAPAFLHTGSHPFLEFGVSTDDRLRALDGAGGPIENLLCTGAVLSGYNPVREASGSGVAIGTGYRAAQHILEESGSPGDDRSG